MMMMTQTNNTKSNIKYPKVDAIAAHKVYLQQNLFEFVKYFWDTFDGAVLKELWLMEYQAEMFQWAVRSFLPDNIKQHWITDEQYQLLKEQTGGECPIREKDVNNHDLNMPPRHSKSTTHNVVGPVWLNTIVPKEVASVSHIQDLATDFNIKRQKIISSAKFEELFGDDPRLKIVKNTAKEIGLAHGGKLYSVGMTNFTGFGADIILCDDIVSSEHAKKDKEVLANARSFFNNTLPTRRNQGDSSVIINVMQRLAPGDVSGMIESDENLLEQYTKTIIKAIATEDKTIIYPCSGKIKVLQKGEYLWPDRFGDYEGLKGLVGEGTFETQYQQNAINSELTYIKRHMINWITWDEYIANYITKGAREYASFDFPVKGKDISDKTGCVLVRKLYAKTAIVDAFEERMGYPEQKRYVTNLQKVKPGIIQIYEDKANGSVLIQDIKDKVPGIVEFEPGTKSKEQRLDIAARYFNSGSIEFVLNKDGQKPKGLKHLEQMLLNFPFVKHDDVVDATSQMAIYLYTDSELKIYGQYFDENNIIDEYPIKNSVIDVAIHKAGTTWKIAEIAQNYSLDEFIVIREHLLYGTAEEVLPALYQIVKGKRLIFESGKEVYNALMGKIAVQPNYTKLLDTIPSVQNGLDKNRIKVMRNCRLTISDIEIFRWSRESYDKDPSNPHPITLNDGFAGCLRVVINAAKGKDAIFY